MINVEQAAMHKIGPLPVVAYAGIGVVAILIMRSRTTSGIATPQAAYPAQSGTPGLQSSGIASPGNTSVTTPVPNQYQETLGNLFGSKNLLDTVNGLGPDYTGFSASEGSLNVQVSHQNSQAVLDQIRAVFSGQNTLANTQGSWANQVAQTQGNANYSAIHDTNAYQNLTNNQLGYWSYLTAAHAASVLNPGQAYVPGGFDSTFSNPAPAPAAPVSSPTPAMGGATPANSSPATCNSGNFSCLRSKCNSGNYSCAGTFAPWAMGLKW